MNPQNPNATIYLHIENPTVFPSVVDWLLSGTIQCSNCLKPQEENALSDQRHFTQWCNLHGFAELFHMPQLASVTMKRMRDCLRESHWLPSAAGISIIFENTKDDSRLRQLFVAETLNAFLGLSRQELENQLGEWTNILSCHSVFQGLFLLELKGCYIQKVVASGVLSSQVVTQQKRKRGASPDNELEQDPSSQATMVDLTSDAAQKSV